MSASLTQWLGPAPAGPVRHLIIAWGLCAEADTLRALAALPDSAHGHLRSLLRGMAVRARHSGKADSLSPPHEQALAQHLGWHDKPDGLLPWAACSAADPQKQAWAWISLCHWNMGREQATLSDPQSLQITAEESEQLRQAMAPYFAAEGITLHRALPGHWLGQGEALDQACASLDRVIARNVDPWLPSGPSARLLRRLQNEMQMLLYTHAVNERRSARSAPPINSIWFSGSGRLTDRSPLPQGLHLARDLADAALGQDPAAYAQAWAQLDAQRIAPLLLQQQQGQSVELTLCGERDWVHLQSAPGGLMRRLLRRAPSWPALLEERP